jgi:hypothetical protein
MVRRENKKDKSGLQYRSSKKQEGRDMPKNKNWYPDNWRDISNSVKEKADWKCTRCGYPHYPEYGYTLTVHHKDGDTSNNDVRNLEALCQRCHLKAQKVLQFTETNQGEFDFINKSDILQGGLI